MFDQTRPDYDYVKTSDPLKYTQIGNKIQTRAANIYEICDPILPDPIRFIMHGCIKVFICEKK